MHDLRREANCSHDASLAGLRWEVKSLRITSIDVVQARECELPEALGFRLGTSIDVSDEHTEALNSELASRNHAGIGVTHRLEGLDF